MCVGPVGLAVTHDRKRAWLLCAVLGMASCWFSGQKKNVKPGQGMVGQRVKLLWYAVAVFLFWSNCQSVF